MQLYIPRLQTLKKKKKKKEKNISESAKDSQNML